MMEKQRVASESPGESEADRRRTAEYIADLACQLESLAKGAKLETLATLLSIARLEAERAARES